MNIQDFLIKVEKQEIDTSLIREMAELYDLKLPEYIKKLLSVSLEGEVFESNDIVRLLSHEEVFNTAQWLNVDFAERNLIPLFDVGDNDYIVFDVEEHCWYKFNIIDGIKFKQEWCLSDFFK